jgi:hypothetical protein
MSTTNPTPAAYILWNTFNRSHWTIAASGSFVDCLKSYKELVGDDGVGYEISTNEIVDSWDNEVSGFHFDTYADGTTLTIPITPSH